MCGGGNHDHFRILDALLLSEVGRFRSRVLSGVLIVTGSDRLHAALVLRRTTAVVKDNVNTIYAVFGFCKGTLSMFVRRPQFTVARFAR